MWRQDKEEEEGERRKTPTRRQEQRQALVRASKENQRSGVCSVAFSVSKSLGAEGPVEDLHGSSKTRHSKEKEEIERPLSGLVFWSGSFFSSFLLSVSGGGGRVAWPLRAVLSPLRSFPETTDSAGLSSKEKKKRRKSDSLASLLLPPPPPLLVEALTHSRGSDPSFRRPPPPPTSWDSAQTFLIQIETGSTHARESSSPKKNSPRAFGTHSGRTARQVPAPVH